MNKNRTYWPSLYLFNAQGLSFQNEGKEARDFKAWSIGALSLILKEKKNIKKIKIYKNKHRGYWKKYKWINAISKYLKIRFLSASVVLWF